LLITAVTGALLDVWPIWCSPERDAVLACLAEAFEDNDAAAAAVDGDEVSLVALVPPVSVVPSDARRSWRLATCR
jgi:hypothetical protein